MENDQAKIVWGYYSHPYLDATKVAGVLVASSSKEILQRCGLPNTGVVCDVAQIHPDLHVANGEYKAILYVNFFCGYSYYKYSDGTTPSNDNAKRMFGFYLLPFKPFGKADKNRLDLAYMFGSNVIFTPNPGLFSETPPK
jgi:hypothetical protein